MESEYESSCSSAYFYSNSDSKKCFVCQLDDSRKRSELQPFTNFDRVYTFFKNESSVKLGDTEFRQRVQDFISKNYIIHKTCLRKHELSFKSENQKNLSDQNDFLVDIKKCIICKGDSSKKRRERKYLCEDEQSKNILNDIKLLLKNELPSEFFIENNTLKNGYFFHKSCLHEIRKKEKKQNESFDMDQSFDESPKETIFKQEIIKEVVDNIVSNMKSTPKKVEFFSISDVKTLIVEKINNSNVTVGNSDIKTYLKDTWLDEIKFYTPQERNQSHVFYHKSIEMDDLINIILSYSMKSAGKELRAVLKTVDFNLDDKFCDANDLMHAWQANLIPPPLINYFSGLFSCSEQTIIDSFKRNDENEFEDTDENIISNLKVLKMSAFFQIMYFLVLSGKKRTPLQLFIGLAIHSACRNRGLITSLNRIGVSASYDEVQRIKTALATYAAKSSGNNVPLPSHFHTDKFTIAATDNFDHNEATMSGIKTTHDTVCVLFQSKSEIHKEKPNISDTGITKRARTFSEKLNCQTVLYYKKPNDIKLPDSLATYSELTLDREIFNNIFKRDFAWLLSRIDTFNDCEVKLFKDSQDVPNWAAFHSFVAEDSRDIQIPGFLPIVPNPVTEYKTVYTVLCNMKNVLSQLSQNSLPIFCDEGVYHIARHITLNEPDEFQNLFVMLGNFHLTKVGLTCVGKYVRDTGIEHAFIEKDVFGITVFEQVLNGSNYARSIKGFFMLYEVLRRLQLEAFFSENPDLNFDDELNWIKNLQDTINEKEKCESISNLKDFEKVSGPMIDKFIEFTEKRSCESELFNFWNNVVKMIQLIKDLVKADRLGLWDLHVQTIKKFMPLFHVMDHINYARWGAVYLNDISNIHVTHPELFTEFQKGKFTVKHSAAPGVSVATDQGLEQTINRSKKSTQGVIGSTSDKSYVTAWDLNFHETLEIYNCFRRLTYVKNDNYELQHHHELSQKKTDKQEQFVQSLINYLKEHTNPFKSGSQILRNLVTEEVVDQSNKLKILAVFETGCSLFNEFWKKRFIDRSVTISVRIHKTNLPSFLQKSSTNEEKKNQKAEAAEKRYSHRIVDLARERNFDLKYLFTFDLTRKNFLFENDYLLKKEKSKSTLAQELKKMLRAEDLTEKPQFSPVLKNCLIVDVMIICRRVHWKSTRNFNEFGNSFLNLIRKIEHTGLLPARIDFVFDMYKEDSLKSDERRRRYGKDGIDLYNITGTTDLPKQEKQFWASDNNKILLQQFLREYIKLHGPIYWQNAEIIFSFADSRKCESTVTRIENDSILQNDEIEEADHRLILHAYDAAVKRFDQIFVISNDTDVIVLLLYYWKFLEDKNIKTLWYCPPQMESDRTKNVLPIHILSSRLQRDVCDILPAMHHLTGSDYTSKVGTKHCGLLASPQDFLSHFAEGITPNDVEFSVNIAEQYLLKVLTINKDKYITCKSFDEYRFFLYSHAANWTLDELPPTSASIKLHILRAFYATYSQISILSQEKPSIDPLNFGYRKDGDELIPERIEMIFPPIDELIPACNCRMCTTKRCSCVSAGINCCIFCVCHKENTCQNKNDCDDSD